MYILYSLSTLDYKSNIQKILSAAHMVHLTKRSYTAFIRK